MTKPFFLNFVQTVCQDSTNFKIASFSSSAFNFCTCLLLHLCGFSFFSSAFKQTFFFKVFLRVKDKSFWFVAKDNLHKLTNSFSLNELTIFLWFFFSPFILMAVKCWKTIEFFTQQLGDFILIIPSMKLLPTTFVSLEHSQQALRKLFTAHSLSCELSVEWIIELHWQQSMWR